MYAADEATDGGEEVLGIGSGDADFVPAQEKPPPDAVAALSFDVEGAVVVMAGTVPSRAVAVDGRDEPEGVTPTLVKCISLAVFLPSMRAPKTGREPASVGGVDRARSRNLSADVRES